MHNYDCEFLRCWRSGEECSSWEIQIQDRDGGIIDVVKPLTDVERNSKDRLICRRKRIPFPHSLERRRDWPLLSFRMIQLGNFGGVLPNSFNYISQGEAVLHARSKWKDGGLRDRTFWNAHCVDWVEVCRGMSGHWGFGAHCVITSTDTPGWFSLEESVMCCRK